MDEWWKMKKEELFKIEQEKWISKISLENNFQLAAIRRVAGIDIAYWTEGKQDYGVCCIVVIDYITKQIIEEVEYWGQIDVPYIPGYLAFRELPMVIEAVKKLQCEPDLYMFDGNGYLHYRHMGIATHASFYLKKPTIGVAKSYLKIKDTDFQMPKNETGNFTYIKVDGEVYGAVLRTRKDGKPIFISCGNWIDLETSIKITLHFVEKNSRLPITTRYADLATHENRRKYTQ
ncbi:endonuclease V [Lysinibacillus boronitolerans]|uniref:endonuclease V n=1 Tax=Lysinibacillus boronitolerans TaxID=309788 RepID=UPI002161B93D|nr:endonuclease V [Lysinibacillus boronitolerans]MCS1394026.1 endonuclease V [Lysinibacillus boronitolerans]